jgi:hypothetical protein
MHLLRLADYQSKRLLRLQQQSDETWRGSTVVSGLGFLVQAMAEDQKGEVYAVRGGDGKGMLYAFPDL